MERSQAEELVHMSLAVRMLTNDVLQLSKALRKVQSQLEALTLHAEGADRAVRRLAKRASK